MDVYTIPKEIKAKIRYNELLKRNRTERIFSLIKELTGIKATAVWDNESLQFKADIRTGDLPGYLRRVLLPRGEFGIKTRGNTKNGKKIEAAYQQEMNKFDTPNDVLSFFMEAVTRGGRLRVVFDTINGDLVIKDQQGFDLEKIGCKKMAVEELLNVHP